MHSVTSYDPVPWWVVVVSYALTVYGAYLLQPHYPDFFAEQGFVRNWTAMLFCIGMLFFIGRGLRRHYGWFPVLALALLVDRELMISARLLHECGLNPRYWQPVAVPLVAGYGLYFVYAKAQLLLEDYRYNRSLGALFIGFTLLSVALAYGGSFILEGSWLERVSRLLFSAIVIYVLGVMRKRSAA